MESTHAPLFPPLVGELGREVSKDSEDAFSWRALTRLVKYAVANVRK
jgi:hypothetical protein